MKKIIDSFIEAGGCSIGYVNAVLQITGRPFPRPGKNSKITGRPFPRPGNGLQIGGRFNAANLLLCSRCGFLALNFNRSTVF